MADYSEKPFETELCEHLAAHGWLYSTDSKGYDKERALFPEDVFGWLADTQPDELAKVVKAGAPDEDKQRALVLNRLAARLDTPLSNGGGTLNVLRDGFKYVAARLSMCEFKPETTMNPTTLDQYDKVRVRVVRQVFFSTADRRSIDLVLFVNGLAVATLELKTDFTQSVHDAIEQYKGGRQPKDPGTNHEQPLLAWGRRALVHFAVSSSEVWMTTHLEGHKTRFLPFNIGYNDGAGNPPAADGKSASAYLWERVLQRDSLLDILGKFMHVEATTKYDPITSQPSTSTTLLFPRFHQWDVVTALTAAARTEGPGHRYLIQHSAGSGKTSSIAWTAHRLARLHDGTNRKVFDSVIVITDRNVLDEQLQEAIRQIDKGAGVVVNIGDDDLKKTGESSKSALLAKSLIDGRLIIVVTIQTFPYALDAIRQNKGLANKNFAVIADEAHSSQTGATANHLKDALSAEDRAILEDGGEIDVESILVAEATARAKSNNISYFAFTATPKPKTLELFGRRPVDDPTGLPLPFHVYTMKQAIEEKYILDVLPGYQTYATAFQIAQNATKGKVKAAGNNEEPQEDSDLFETKIVDETTAVKGLMQWVKLHPTNISQKVRIIVEHFRSNVEHLLDGHAKAMVVTDSRKAAVRYKLAIDKYIADNGYAMKTLVAFSGKIEDAESGPGEFTESSMNPGLGGQSLRSAFDGNDYKVMLVANKFQTGFDQPLLCAMYVDKLLSGVAAVQTLSRLNRVYRTPSGTLKGQPLVLDFVNDPEAIRKSFEPYYTDAFLEKATDPNLVHDISTKLDQAAIFTDEDVTAAAEAFVKRQGHGVLDAAMGSAANEFRTRYQAAAAANGGAGDKAALAKLDMFRKDVSTFVHLYDFMSQIVDYGDADLEKRSIFLRLLERLIRKKGGSATIDLSDVSLVAVKQIDTGSHDLGLGKRKGLRGVTAAGSGVKRPPNMVAFAAVIERLNDLFGDEEFSPGVKSAFVQMILETLLENKTLMAQVKNNSAQQFIDSPTLKNALLVTLTENQDATGKMTDFFFGDSANIDALIIAIGRALYEEATVAEDEPTPSETADERDQ